MLSLYSVFYMPCNLQCSYSHSVWYFHLIFHILLSQNIKINNHFNYILNQFPLLHHLKISDIQSTALTANYYYQSISLFILTYNSKIYYFFTKRLIFITNQHSELFTPIAEKFLFPSFSFKSVRNPCFPAEECQFHNHLKLIINQHLKVFQSVKTGRTIGMRTVSEQ